MSQKILFISRAYGTEAGGMERLSYELIASFSNISDFQIKVLANVTRKNESLLAARIRSILFLFIIIPKSLYWARDIDLVHISDPVLSFVGWLIQRLYKKPVAVTVHGLDIHYKNFFYQLYLKVFFRHFSLYIPISSYVEKLLLPFNVQGKIIKINPGLTDKHFDPSLTRNDLSGILGRDISKNKVLLTIGRLVKRKGHEWFIRNVFPKLPHQAIYVIVGDGPERESIQKAISSHHLDQRIIMLGRVDNATLKILYNTVDMFIQPNIEDQKDIEGFGLVLAEAALCNCPVFVSRFQGMTDAIHDGKNGYLITLEDSEEWVTKISAFLDKPGSLSSVREYTLDNFSWDTISQKYTTAFSGVLSCQ